jgi:hypothetical protein
MNVQGDVTLREMIYDGVLVDGLQIEDFGHLLFSVALNSAVSEVEEANAPVGDFHQFT